MSDHEEYVLAHNGSSATDVKKSKFYGFASPVSSREEIDARLGALKADFSDASHIVYAFRLGAGGSQEHFTDSGEPSGTAGAPIMRTLKGRKITNALVAVVRYFGGTKLGTGGLARAYGDAARLAIESAGIIPFIETARVRAKIPYSAVSQWAILLDSLGGISISQKFERDVLVEAKVPVAQIQKIREFVAEVTRGKEKLEIIE